MSCSKHLVELKSIIKASGGQSRDKYEKLLMSWGQTNYILLTEIYTHGRVRHILMLWTLWCPLILDSCILRMRCWIAHYVITVPHCATLTTVLYYTIILERLLHWWFDDKLKLMCAISIHEYSYLEARSVLVRSYNLLTANWGHILQMHTRSVSQPIAANFDISCHVMQDDI